MTLAWEKEERGRLVELLKRDALRLGTFTLASGRSSHYYIDGRRVTLQAEGSAPYCRWGAQPLGRPSRGRRRRRVDAGSRSDCRCHSCCCCDDGGRELRGFLVRKQAKTHGTGNLVEGPVEPGSVVAIVDDVATTGGSSLQAIDAVEALGARSRGGRCPRSA